MPASAPNIPAHKLAPDKALANENRNEKHARRDTHHGNQTHYDLPAHST
jgi:hypothetical protein